MTLQSFYRRVPYVEVSSDKYGNLRHCEDSNLCLIDVAGGEWEKKDGGLGLDDTTRQLIITAADNTIAQLKDTIKAEHHELTRKRNKYYDKPLTESEKNLLIADIRFNQRAIQVRKVFERRIALAKGV